MVVLGVGRECWAHRSAPARKKHPKTRQIQRDTQVGPNETQTERHTDILSLRLIARLACKVRGLIINNGPHPAPPCPPPPSPTSPTFSALSACASTHPTVSVHPDHNGHSGVLGMLGCTLFSLEDRWCLLMSHVQQPNPSITVYRFSLTLPLRLLCPRKRPPVCLKLPLPVNILIELCRHFNYVPHNGTPTSP